MSGPLGSSQFMYATGAEEGQSLRFEDGDSAYLSFTPASAGNRKTYTWSSWVKRGNLTSYMRLFQTTSTYSDSLILYNDDTIVFWGRDASNWNLQTNAVLRDVSAWYHIVVSVDTTQATASDRMKIYVNNELQTLSTATYPSQNLDCFINNTQAHYIGTNSASGQYFDGYLANVTFIDGTALTPTSFGEYEGTLWRPKSDTDITSLTFGTNGFYLPFKQTTEAEGFSTVTYTGNGSTHGIEGLGLEPDFVWIKDRTTGSSHRLHDSVRGAGIKLSSDTTAAEVDESSSFTSFDADGFSLAGSAGAYNTSGRNYVAWCWDAGTGSAVSNTDGSITSTVKANTTNGFSIVSYTGTGANATVGHGLGVAPDMIILKNRDLVDSWLVKHSSFADDNTALFLNETGQAGSSSTYWNNTAPTTSVFSVGTDGKPNGSGQDIIAYCFAEKTGYSSIGSYSGNGSASGPTVTTGFKPAFVMIKRTDSTSGWTMFDNTRNVDGLATKELYANDSAAEASGSSNYTSTSTGFDITTTNSWVNASGGTYIYMAFADTRDATFFGDTSGNGNNWTPNALNNTDVVSDSPVTNFATLNPLDKVGVSLSQGNLKSTATAASFQAVRSTVTYPSGSWYAEVRSDAGTGNGNSFVGITRVSDALSTMTGSNLVGTSSTAWGYSSNGNIYNSNAVDTATGTTWSAGDIIGVAFDGSSVKFYKNNSLIHTESSLTGDYVLSLGAYSADAMTANFGQDSSFAGNETPQGNTDDNGQGDFYYAPPSGFLALNRNNLPSSDILDPADYFNTVLYTGNSSTQSITGVNFQPDWVWIKNRTHAYDNMLFDAVRGTESYLESNTTDAESNSPDVFTSFDVDGFTVEYGPSTRVNESGSAYVAWNWLAGGTAVSNTDGSITSSVSANTDAGFSVVGWTGTGAVGTLGHGLGAEPYFIVVKARSVAGEAWYCYHKTLGNGARIQLNEDSAVTNGSTVWNTTTPTSSVFSIGNGNPNTSGATYIAYCFAEVENYSLISSYTGNGSTDGTFVHCGFRPAWVMVKRSSNTDNWFIWDSARDSYNLSNSALSPSLSYAESSITGDEIDILSSGFKLRTTNAIGNASGDTYIFLAFAEAPFKNANAR